MVASGAVVELVVVASAAVVVSPVVDDVGMDFVVDVSLLGDDVGRDFVVDVPLLEDVLIVVLDWLEPVADVETSGVLELVGVYEEEVELRRPVKIASSDPSFEVLD